MEKKVVKKNDVTMEKLILLMAKYIKECKKSLNEDKPCVEVRISMDNWYGGSGRDRFWKYDDIKFNGEHYNFYDKEIGRHGLIDIVKKALDKSGVKGNIKTNKWESWNGWKYINHEDFDRLIIYGKPCKEFKILQNLIKKYSGKEIKECEVYSANICGKRDSWSESGIANYLDFDKTNCQRAIDFIRCKRTSKDELDCQIHNKLIHEDEGDYKYAMYQESEWYGNNVNYLEINVFTPTGKNKGNIKIAPSYVY